MKTEMNTRDLAIGRLQGRYTCEELDKWRKDLTILFQVCGHPSVLAAMRLMLQAHNLKKGRAK